VLDPDDIGIGGTRFVHDSGDVGDTVSRSCAFSMTPFCTSMTIKAVFGRLVRWSWCPLSRADGLLRRP